MEDMPAPPSPPPPGKRMLVYAITAAIMVVGPLNFLLFRLLYDSFGSEYAFFVSQGVNAFYVVVGGLVLYPRMWSVKRRVGAGAGVWPWTLEPRFDEITQSMRSLPQKAFMQMAVLDCAGTFLGAMGAVGTPGQIQTLLNQALIPCTMTCSALFLRSRYTTGQYGGALTILAGALIAVAPSFIGFTGMNAGPVMLYLASNIPMALSAVYKEHRFASDDISPLYLTQWVSIYQFLFGFLLMPLQLVPGVASAQGLTAGQTVSSFRGGWACYLERSGACPSTSAGTFWLLPAYVFVNYLFNTLGLFLTKHGGANLNSISYSMLLPLATLSNALPFLGSFREDLQMSTLLGLGVVLGGFAVYENLCVPSTWPLSSSSSSLSEGRGEVKGMSEAAAAAATAATIAKDGKEDRRHHYQGRKGEKQPCLQSKPGGGLGDYEAVFAPVTSAPPPAHGGKSGTGGDGGGGSARKQRTASYQERLVLVPLPIRGTVSRAQSSPSSLA
mmetsp:Transcript_82036/g.163889  ORF Transcript_82036/g.163889 Transcript_82036/m.163889 type:complete len:498 (+) Transcript_82036:230-1723(+)